MAKAPWFEELKRRHVVRAAIIYIAAVWALAQGIAQLTPTFGLPELTTRWFVIACAIGFPFWLAFAWYFRITGHGIERESEHPLRDATASRSTGRKLDYWIIGILCIAVVLLLTNVFVTHRNVTIQGITIVPTAAAIPAKSVAVLPFVNGSGDENQQFFSDGLTEDLINALSQFAGLKVISRNSAFRFRGSTASSKVIGEKLGVAHLLEGSVRKLGDEVRIIAELVNAADGSTLWSQHYDRPYKDLFALQDAITEAVADALQAKLLATPGAVVQSDRPPSSNLAAYAAYQRGMAFNAQDTEASLRKAIAAFGEATRLDPRYAAAYARLSFARLGLAELYLAGAVQRHTYSEACAAAETALALNPNLALAHVARGDVLLDTDFDWRGAQSEYQRALRLAPQDGDVMFSLGSLDAALGQVHRAVDLTRRALAADPLHAIRYNWLSVYLAGLNRLDDAQRMIRQAIALQPAADGFHEQLAVVEILRGEPESALTAAQGERNKIWRREALALALQIGPDRNAADAALATLIAKDASVAPYQIAEVYALRRNPDAMFRWLDRAWSARDPGIQLLLSDPFILRYRADARFAAFCKKVGLPTTTDAVAMK